MRLWLAYLVLGLSVAFLAALVLAGCTTTPTEPQINVTGNSGTVNVIVPTGTNSAGGTAPCGATTVPNGSAGCPTTNNTTNNNAEATR